VTCIVGIETESGVILGADSCAADGWGSHVRAEPKLFRVGAHVLGFTTSFRMGDLLRYHLKLPDPPKRGHHRHLVTQVIPLIRACLKEGGFATTKDGADVGGDFLIGVHGSLFRVESDYQVGRSAFGYNATGSGGYVALGALAATEGRKPKDRLRLALEASSRHVLGVRGPWHFLAEMPWRLLTEGKRGR